jgi:hypothetical protein
MSRYNPLTVNCRYVLGMAVSLIWLSAPANIACAAPISYNFSGHLTAVTWGTPPLGIAVGTLFSGKVVIDSESTTTSTQNQLAANIFEYRGSRLDLTVGPLVFLDSNPLVEYAGSSNDNQIFIGGSPTLLSGTAEPGRYLAFAFFDMTAFAISTGKVMGTLPDLDSFAIRKFEITEYTPNFAGDALFQADGFVDILTSESLPEPIPEPGTYLLLAIPVLLGLTLRRQSGSIARASG